MARKILGLLLIGFVTVAFCATAEAGRTVPEEFSRVTYFYVFGADGNPFLGAEDNVMNLFIDVPVSVDRIDDPQYLVRIHTCVTLADKRNVRPCRRLLLFRSYSLGFAASC